METENAKYKTLHTKRAEELIRGFDLVCVKDAIEPDTNYYLKSYWSLVKLAKYTFDDDKHACLRSLALATYGWMPTIIKRDHFERFQCNDPVHAIKAVKNPQEAEKFIGTMCKDAPINNSWVGTSKLMHFLNPEIFPIWDSKIAVIFGFKSYSYNKKAAYLEYVQFMHSQVANAGNQFSGMAKLIKDRYGYWPSDIRCLEFYLFTVSDKEARKIKASESSTRSA